MPEPLEAWHYSGKLVVRMPASLHRRVALLAQLDGVSINQWIVSAIVEKAGVQTAKPAPFETAEAVVLQSFREPAHAISSKASKRSNIGWRLGRSVPAQDPAEG